MEELNAPRREHVEINERLSSLLEALQKYHREFGHPLYFDVYPIDPNDSNAGYTVDGWEA